MPAKEATPFSRALDQRVEEGALGTLYEKLPDNQLRCYACAHRCLIKEGLRGICKVRYNRGGTLMVPRGYVGALQCDPIEKKPFFHAFPGTDALTFGMLGATCTVATASPARFALQRTRECEASPISGKRQRLAWTVMRSGAGRPRP